MAEDEALLSVRRNVTEIRRQCANLQRLEALHEGNGVAELWRIARAGKPDDEIVFDLCRLLFRARDGEPVRQRWSVAWELIGGANGADCPLAPYHVFQGVPFYIAMGLRHMGLVEPADHYLSYCLEAGVWISEPYREGCQDHVLAAHGLADHGPWSRPLHSYERDWLLAQVPGGVSKKNGWRGWLSRCS